MEKGDRERHIEFRKRTTLNHYLCLKQTIDSILLQVKAGLIDSGDLQRRLIAAQVDLEALNSLVIGGQIETIYYNERRGNDSTIAGRVFSIPEITELILQYVDRESILAMYEVNRALRDIINGSRTLLQRLSLLPDTSCGQPHFPFAKGFWEDERCGFFCNEDSRRMVSENCCALPVRAEIRPQSLQMSCGVNPRYRQSMYPIVLSENYTDHSSSVSICQPPILEMQVELVDHHIVLGPIRAEEGLTVGDLFDCHKRVLKAYKHGQIRFRGWIYPQGV